MVIALEEGRPIIAETEFEIIIIEFRARFGDDACRLDG